MSFEVEFMAALWAFLWFAQPFINLATWAMLFSLMLYIAKRDNLFRVFKQPGSQDIPPRAAAHMFTKPKKIREA